jgi:hypothetical protein
VRHVSRRGSAREFTAVGFALVLAVSCGSIVAPTSSPSPRVITIVATVAGLPTGTSAQLWQTTPASGGGYIRDQQLGTTSASLDVGVAVGSFVEAAPISRTGERWQPADRFQEVKADTKTLAFAYRHEFMITIGIWSLGGDASTFGMVMGTVTPNSDWYPEGTTITFTATPVPGWRFAHWGLFDAGDAGDQQRNSGEATTFTITITKSVRLLGGFVPAGSP